MLNSGHGSTRRFAVGDPVRIKDDAHTEFAGREGWIRSDGEPNALSSPGYYVRVGTADWLWFGEEEVEARV